MTKTYCDHCGKVIFQGPFTTHCVNCTIKTIDSVFKMDLCEICHADLSNKMDELVASFCSEQQNEINVKSI